MSVSQTAERIAKTAGNGINTAFDFAFKIFAASDLTCLKVDALGAYTPGVLGVDYTVAFDSDAETGTVTWVVAPVNGGFSVIIGDDLPDTQATNFPREGITPAATLKNAFDKLTVLHQQERDRLNRAPLQPLTPVNPNPIIIEAPVDGRFLKYVDNGDNTFSIVPLAFDATDVLAAAAVLDTFRKTGTFAALDAMATNVWFIAHVTDMQQIMSFLGDRALGDNGWITLGGYDAP